MRLDSGSAASRRLPNPPWLRWALPALLLGAFALRLTELARQNIWWDEARNLDVALRPFLQIANAPELDIQPPLYYWALHGWLRILGSGRGDAPAELAWLGRWLSVWAGVLCVALVIPLAKRLAGPRAAFSAGLLAALSPFWLAESQETRMYTVGLALLAAAAWLLLRLVQDEESGTRRWVRLGCFALLSAAAFLVHYNAVFVLVAWYVWWAAASLMEVGRWRKLRELLFTGVASALLVAPILPVALRQIPGYENPNLVVPSVADYLRQNWQGHVAGYAWDAAAYGGLAFWWLWGVLILAAVGLALLAAQRVRPGAASRREFLRELSFSLAWLAGGLLLYYLAVLDRGAFNVRYSAFVTPALVCLLGAGIAGWGRWLSWPVLAVTVAGLALFVRADLYNPRFAREDSAGVADWLREKARPGDLILVDQKYPLGFYYGRYAIPPAEPGDGPELAPARYLFVDINTIDAVLNAWAADARRIFWVQWFESDTDPRHAVTFLLNKEGRHAGEQWFQGWSIDWWELSPPTEFALAPDLHAVSARFPAAVETVAASYPVTIAAGTPLPVAIRWRRSAEAPLDRPLKARVALYDRAGSRLAQADERVLNDRHLAPSQWSAEDQPLNVYLLESDQPLPAGTYDLKVLVYDAETLEPLETVDASGNPAGIEATLGQVQIDPHG